VRRFIVIGVLATLVGVAFVLLDLGTSAPAVARHTVAEYRADAQLRREVFTQCVNDPGTLGETPDCVNAREAERLEGRGSLRDLPPIGLDTAPRR
jgi:hypothetical protein